MLLSLPSQQYYLENNFVKYYPTDGYGVAIYNIDSRDTIFFQGKNDNLKKLFELKCFDLPVFQQLITAEIQEATQLINRLLLHNIISKKK
jgi:hypothetical protein